MAFDPALAPLLTGASARPSEARRADGAAAAPGLSGGPVASGGPAGQGESSDAAALRAVAGQFEALFVGLLLKSVRDAQLADPAFENDGSRLYQDMFDREIAGALGSSGRGLGIAEMLFRQLGAAPPAPPGGAPPARDPGGTALPLQASHAGHFSAGFGDASLPAAASAPAGDAARTGWAGGAGPQLPPAVARVDAPAPGRGAGRGAGAGATAAGGVFADTPEDFVRRVLPHAERAAAALGVDARVLVAQAALETGWGRQLPAGSDGSGFNLFGIKAGPGWSGARLVRETLEFGPAGFEPRREAFRAYDSLEAGFADYVALVGRSPRYAAARAAAGDPAGYAAALQAAGYATDPDYARKLESILAGPTLREALAGLKDGDARPTD